MSRLNTSSRLSFKPSEHLIMNVIVLVLGAYDVVSMIDGFFVLNVE